MFTTDLPKPWILWSPTLVSLAAYRNREAGLNVVAFHVRKAISAYSGRTTLAPIGHFGVLLRADRSEAVLPANMI